ncbi:MAG: 40S ribosomal protein S19, partial [Conexivisphaerales archaeon]
WAAYTKTGSQAERPPQNKDWWYVRAASIMRKLYLHGPIGLSDLRVEYGGLTAVGYTLAHHRDAGSSNIRKIIAQLQAAGLLHKTTKGRVVTAEGRRLLDKLSTEIFKDMTKENKELGKIVS